MKAIYGEVAEIKKIRSRGISRVHLEFPIEHHRQAAEFADDMKCLVILAPKELEVPYGMIDFGGGSLSGQGQKVEQKAPVKPNPKYGKAAQALFKSGFFYNPRLWPHIGSPKKYEDWIRGQKCIITGEQDWNEQLGEGQCEPCHVRRVSAGAGTAIKPDYSVVPMVHELHLLQHSKGESAIFTKYSANMPEEICDIETLRDWFEKKAKQHVARWSKEALVKILGYESWTMVPPNALVDWLGEKDLSWTLPAGYIE